MGFWKQLAEAGGADCRSATRSECQALCNVPCPRKITREAVTPRSGPHPLGRAPPTLGGGLGLGVQQTQHRGLAPLILAVELCQLTYLSVPQFPHL